MDYPLILFWLLVAIIILCAILVVRSIIKEEGLRALLLPLGTAALAIAALAIAGIIWLR